jgi:uncharacterized MAPEG superfamily protein
MAMEFTMLGLSIALGLLHVILSHAASLRHGYGWPADASSAAAAPLTGMATRLDSTMRNYLETFTFFAAAVMLSHNVGGRASFMAVGSQLYFYSRLAYLPLCVFGVPYLRSAVWTLSVLGIALVLLSTL